MSPTDVAMLATSTAVLAATPSISVLAVSARSASLGFHHGVFTTFGILAGDIFFILLALFGLRLLAEVMGSHTYLIGYVAGIYLLVLGTRLWASANAGSRHEVTHTSLLSSFWTGLLITLADQKAVLFYLGFFPAFVDLKRIGAGDIAIVLGITIVAVGGVKLAYAFAAERAAVIFGSAAGNILNKIAAAIMIAVGVYLLWNTYDSH